MLNPGEGTREETIWGIILFFIFIVIACVGLSLGQDKNEVQKSVYICEKPWYSSTTYCK